MQSRRNSIVVQSRTGIEQSFVPSNKSVKDQLTGQETFHCSFKFVGGSIEEIPRGETIPNQVILAQRKNGVTISENKLTFNLRLGCKQRDVGSLLQKKSMIMFLYWKIWRLHSSRRDLTRCTCGLNDRRKFDVVEMFANMTREKDSQINF